MTDPTTAAAAELGMTPTQGAPLTSAQATARLKELEADREWGARLARGDDVARRKFVDLTTLAASGDPIDSIMAGVVPNTIEVDETGGAKARAVDQVAAVTDLRARGIPDQAIRELLSDMRPTREQHEEAKRFQARNFADPGWVAALMAGDPIAQREFFVNSWAIGCFEDV